MEREEAVVFFALVIFIIAVLIVIVLKKIQHEEKSNKSGHPRINQERYDLKRSAEVLKDKVQDKSKPKSANKKKRKLKLKKDEQGLVGRPPKSPRKHKGDKKVSNNSSRPR